MDSQDFDLDDLCSMGSFHLFSPCKACEWVVLKMEWSQPWHSFWSHRLFFLTLCLVFFTLFVCGVSSKLTVCFVCRKHFSGLHCSNSHNCISCHCTPNSYWGGSASWVCDFLKLTFLCTTFHHHYSKVFNYRHSFDTIFDIAGNCGHRQIFETWHYSICWVLCFWFGIWWQEEDFQTSKVPPMDVSCVCEGTIWGCFCHRAYWDCPRFVVCYLGSLCLHCEGAWFYLWIWCAIL